MRVFISWCSFLFKNNADNILHLLFSSARSHSISYLLNLRPDEKIKFEYSELKNNLLFKNLWKNPSLLLLCMTKFLSFEFFSKLYFRKHYL